MKAPGEVLSGCAIGSGEAPAVACEICGYLLHAPDPGAICTECGAPRAISSVRLNSRLQPSAAERGVIDPRVILCQAASSACVMAARRSILISAVVMITALVIAQLLQIDINFPMDWPADSAPLPILVNITWILHACIPIVFAYAWFFLTMRAWVVPGVQSQTTWWRATRAAWRLATLAHRGCVLGLWGVNSFILLRVAWALSDIDVLYSVAFWVLCCSYACTIGILLIDLQRFMAWLRIGALRTIMSCLGVLVAQLLVSALIAFMLDYGLVFWAPM